MKKITYKKAGVDIKKANLLIEDIKPVIASTKRKGMIGNIGAFAGFFKPDLKKYKEPFIVASTDGVGTKLLIAQDAGIHNTVGIDLVAMCVNDLVTCGAEPLFFLDYFACGRLKKNVMKDVIAGIAEGCRLANVALIGGETAELPGMYEKDVYDMAGFSIGIVDKKNIIDGSSVRTGDVILGIQSSGIHSNGYSMVRKIFSKRELKGNLKKNILAPTKIYVTCILDLIKRINVKAIANITGGGFFDNIIRVLPEQKTAVILKNSWDIPDIFKLMQKKGNVEETEMFRTFNMGIGMIAVLSKTDINRAKRLLAEKHGLKSWVIGHIIKGKRTVDITNS